MNNALHRFIPLFCSQFKAIKLYIYEKHLMGFPSNHYLIRHMTPKLRSTNFISKCMIVVLYHIKQIQFFEIPNKSRKKNRVWECTA